MDDSKASSIDIIPTLLYLADKESDFSAFDGFPVSKIPSDRIRKAYWVTYLSALPPFLGVDGNPLLYNCFREFLLTEDGGYSLLRYIPYNKNVKIDDNQLINRSINK